LFIDKVINLNPLFVNPDIDNYKLSIDSPCIDTGTSRYTFENITILDLPKNSYNGSEPDMGSYEFDRISSVKSIDTDSSVNVSNYPNPFNANTTIQVVVNTSKWIRINIYNILGEKITTLYNGKVNLGKHIFIWNAKKESTGIYFYKIEFGNAVRLGKIMLIK
jgi:hypothetical protein